MQELWSRHAAFLTNLRLGRLDHLRGQHLEPGLLFKLLAESGICVCPKGNGGALSIKPKRDELESKLHSDVATFAPSFMVTGSKWHQVFAEDRSKCCFRVKEALDWSIDSPEAEDGSECRTVLFELDEDVKNGVKCSFIRATDAADDFDGEREEGLKTHAYMFQALRDIATEEALERNNSASLRFRETIKSVLHLTRPFSFFCPGD